MNEKRPKVAVIMGSDSDLPIVRKTINVLKRFNVDFDVNIMSAHRTPEIAVEYVKNADKNGIDLFIGAAGKAAHLPGVLAAFTVKPVIGLPIKSSTLDGMDSLLSIVQMPSGIPVATVAIDGGENAGLLAVQILALKYPELAEKLYAHKEKMKQDVIEKNNKIKQEVF